MREFIFGVVDSYAAAPYHKTTDDEPYPWPQMSDVFLPPSVGNVVGEGLTATEIEALLKFRQNRMVAEFHGYGSGQQLELTWDFQLPFEFAGWGVDAIVVPHWETSVAGNGGVALIVRDSHNDVILTTPKFSSVDKTLIKIPEWTLGNGVFIPRTQMLVTARITVDDGQVTYVGSFAANFKRVHRSERSRIPYKKP
jgi:hypothetical protein